MAYRLKDFNKTLISSFKVEWELPFFWISSQKKKKKLTIVVVKSGISWY